MSLFTKKSASGDDTDGVDDGVYATHLKLAQDSDLSIVENSGCVSQGTDEVGHPIIIFIPSIGFGYRDKSEELLRQMLLLLIKFADSVVSQPYSIIYSHASINWLNQQPIVYEYYKMLPRKYKKNLCRIYVMHPQVGIRMFFEFARVFLSAKFYNKLQFVDTVAEFQRIIPPTLVRLPNSFLLAEDEERGLKASGVVVPLSLDFDSHLGTTTLMARCVTYIRDNGGVTRKGLFRVAGDETMLSLVRIRVQPPPTVSVDVMRIYMHNVCIGTDYSHQRTSSTISGSASYGAPGDRQSTRHVSIASASSASSASAAGASSGSVSKKKEPRKSITLKKDGSGVAGKGGNDSSNVIEVPLDSISTVIVTDIDTVAQVLKMSLRDLPVPLVTFQAYDKLLELTKQLEARSISRDKWVHAATQALKEMPIEHSSTLAYLLDFLREVAAESGVNQMDVSNLATVFAPTLLRPEHQDTTDMMKAFGDVRLCQVLLMNFLNLPPNERVAGQTTLHGTSSQQHRLSTNHSKPPRHSPSTASAASEDADVHINEKMLNRFSNLNIHARNSHSSVGRPALSGADGHDLPVEGRTSLDSIPEDGDHIHKSASDRDADDALAEELRRFDEEMEAANREHELQVAQNESRGVGSKARRKSRRRSSRK